jgi:hypothetical protein
MSKYQSVRGTRDLLPEVKQTFRQIDQIAYKTAKNYGFGAEFQLRQEHLCMPFNVYQKALEASLGRSIATHELGDRNRLIAELSGVTVL